MFGPIKRGIAKALVIRDIYKRISLTGTAGWTDLLSGGIGGGLSLPGLARPAETVHSVYAALMARTRTIKKAPLRISDRDGNIVENGELSRLMERPNRWQNRSQYVGYIEANLALHDWCIVAKISDTPGGRPDELIPLNPLKCMPRQAVHGPTGMEIVAGWDYIDHGGSVFLPWDDVIAITGTNPYSAFEGLSAMKAGRRPIMQDVATREQSLALYKNGAMVDLVLETDKSPDRDQRKEMMQSWNDRYRGYTNAHKTALLWGGVKASKLGFNPQELQQFENLRLTLTDVLMVMQVMPAMIMVMIGETGLSQGSSTAEQYAAWWNNVGWGELDRIAAAHQAFLVDSYDWGRTRMLRKTEPRKPTLREAVGRQMWRERAGVGDSRSDLDLYFDVGQIPELAEQRNERIEKMADLCKLGYRPDDANDYLGLGLPPHPTNAGTLPFNLQPVGDVAGGGERARSSAVEIRGRIERGDRIGGLLDRLEERIERDLNAKQKSVRKAFEAYIAPREKAAARKWSRFFMEQRKRVLERLKEEGDRAEADPAAKVLFEAVFPRGDENAALIALLSPLWSQHIEDGVAYFDGNEIPGDGISGMTSEDPRFQQALEQRRIQGAKVNDTTEKALREIMEQAVADGASVGDLADRFAEYYKDQAVGEKAARPLTAARTQTAGIVNDGRMLAAREVGGLRKGWLQGSSEEPRPAHAAATSKYQANPIGLDESFEINGHAMDAPGDASAPASETANCTCMVTFHGPAEGEE